MLFRTKSLLCLLHQNLHQNIRKLVSACGFRVFWSSDGTCLCHCMCSQLPDALPQILGRWTGRRLPKMVYVICRINSMAQTDSATRWEAMQRIIIRQIDIRIWHHALRKWLEAILGIRRCSGFRWTLSWKNTIDSTKAIKRMNPHYAQCGFILLAICRTIAAILSRGDSNTLPRCGLDICTAKLKDHKFEPIRFCHQTIRTRQIFQMPPLLVKKVWCLVLRCKNFWGMDRFQRAAGFYSGFCGCKKGKCRN